MNFRSASKAAVSEIAERRLLLQKVLSFGINFLDESTGGVLPNDIIAVGAPSGVGKTAFCCNMAAANIVKGKKVHLFALEASENEIERRMKYPIIADLYYSDMVRKPLRKPFNFRNWYLGFLIDEMYEYEIKAAEIFEEKYKNIFLFYKNGDFGSDQFIQNVMSIASQTDLIIVDHIHYFDFDDDNENRAIKNLVKTARTLGNELQKPIVLVGHLRKKDRGNDDLVAGMEEFHGSSDFYKISTKVLTISPGNPTLDGKGFETYFRVPKNRIDGSPTRFSARCIFDTKKGVYEEKYDLGHANQSRINGFKELDSDLLPDWAVSANRSFGVGSNNSQPHNGFSKILTSSRRTKAVRNFAPGGDRD